MMLLIVWIDVGDPKQVKDDLEGTTFVLSLYRQSFENFRNAIFDLPSMNLSLRIA
jgi:hypothetical protein